MKFLKNVKTDEFMATVTRTASKYGYKLKKASPTIMIFGAAIVGVAATVSACKATVKAQDILEDHNEMVKAIHETKEKVNSGEMILKEGAAYTENDYKKDLTTAYVQTGLKLAKIYAPAVTMGTVALGCMFGSHHIMTKRNASLTAAYIALDKAFNEYKGRVTDRFGDRVQQELEHNIKAVEVETYHKLFGWNPRGIVLHSPEYLPVRDVLATAKASGGAVVFAHPTVYKSMPLVRELAAEGAIDGIEVDHPSNSPEDRAECVQLCREYGLVPTAGTDFHGRNHKVPHPIGTCTAPDETVTRLQEIARKRGGGNGTR